MKVLLLEASTTRNEKTGEVYNVLKVFGTVQKFGKASKEAFAVKVPDAQRYKDQVGKELDLNILTPYQEFSYQLL